MTSDDFARHIIDMTQTLYRVACSQLPAAADREDAVQETLRKAWEKRGRLRDERYLQTWVIRILINECHTIQRRAKRVTPMEAFPPAADTAGAQPSLTGALLSLEERFRMPLLLHYIEGYPLEDVSAMLHVPKGTVKSRMARGREKLRAILMEEVFES